MSQLSTSYKDKIPLIHIIPSNLKMLFHLQFLQEYFFLLDSDEADACLDLDEADDVSYSDETVD